jgi:hypothetical protein
MALSDKQAVFVAEYLKCFNASEAARRAGYSDKWVNTNAAKILQNTSVRDAVSDALQEKVMSANEALSRMSEIARGVHSAYIIVDDDGPGVDIEQMIADDKAHLIKSITPTQYGVKIEFCDMQAALNTILKHHGALIDRSDVTSGGESLNAIGETRERLLATIAGIRKDGTGG